MKALQCLQKEEETGKRKGLSVHCLLSVMGAWCFCPAQPHTANMCCCTLQGTSETQRLPLSLSHPSCGRRVGGLCPEPSGKMAWSHVPQRDWPPWASGCLADQQWGPTEAQPCLSPLLPPRPSGEGFAYALEGPAGPALTRKSLFLSVPGWGPLT